MLTFLKRLAASVPTPATDKVTVFVEDSTGEPSYKDDTGTVASLKGDPGEGVPAGGTTGQVLRKIDGADYNTEWATPGADRNVVTPLSSSAGVVTVDLSLGDYFSFTPTEAVTSWSFTNEPTAYSVSIVLTQGATPYAVAMPASLKWAGGAAEAFSTGANEVDEINISSTDAGSTRRAVLGKGFA